MESIVDFSSKRNIREHIDQGFKALTEIKSALPLDMVFKVVCVVASKVASEIEVSKDEYKVRKLLKAEVVAAVVEAQVGLGAVDVQACEVQMDELGEMGCQVAMALF